MKILPLILLVVFGVFVAVFVAQSRRSTAGTEVRIWEEERLEIQAALDTLIEEFNRRHRGEIVVTRSHFGTEDLRVNYQTAVLAAGGPEILLAPNDFGGVFSTMGVLEEASWYFDEQDVPEALAQAVEGEGGSHWGVPLNMGNHLLLYVNRALTDDVVPKTLAEIEALRRSDDEVFPLAFNMFEPFWFVPFFGLWEERPLQQRRPNLDHDACRRALALLQRYVEESVIPESCDYSCAEALFLEGKAMTTINGDWALDKYAEALGDRLAILPLPAVTAGSPPMEPMLSGKYFFLRKNSDARSVEAARTVVRWFTSAETQAKLTSLSKRLPAVASVLDSAAVREDPLLEKSLVATEFAYPMPFAVEMRAVWDAIRPPLRAALSSERLAPSKACAAMQVDATRRIAEMRQ